MAQALVGLKPPTDPRLLVGVNTADDAGVFLVDEGLALVQTVDLLTPMVEDPYTFGRIAATNSLSDVYAMGGSPLTALNIVGFPAPLDKQILAEILRGGQDAVLAAGAVICGGHTFNEKEIKYGLSVTGRINPAKIVTNAGAKPGDALLLTKPLGTGVFAQVMMTADSVDPEFYRAAVASMTQLNRVAGKAMARWNASAATDITGYGLLGHAQEMAEASKVSFVLDAAQLPILPRALDLCAAGIEDPGMLMNESSFASYVTFQTDVPLPLRKLMWESETSGGLLISLSEQLVDGFRREVEAEGVSVAVIGSVVDGSPGTILVGTGRG